MPPLFPFCQPRPRVRLALFRSHNAVAWMAQEPKVRLMMETGQGSMAPMSALDVVSLQLPRLLRLAAKIAQPWADQLESLSNKAKAVVREVDVAARG